MCLFKLPSFFISQWASTIFPGMIESNQYLPLTACPPSLALISLHVSAGSSGMEPRGTREKKSRHDISLFPFIYHWCIYIFIIIYTFLLQHLLFSYISTCLYSCLLQSNIYPSQERNLQVWLPWCGCSTHTCTGKWRNWSFDIWRRKNIPAGKHRQVPLWSVYRCVAVASCQGWKFRLSLGYIVEQLLHRAFDTGQVKLECERAV